MASGRANVRGSGAVTSTVRNEKHATLRIRVQKMQQEMTTKFEQQLQNARTELETLNDDDELLAFVDNKFDVLNGEFNRHSDELRAQVKSKMPTKPKLQTDATEAERAAANAKYEQEVNEFKSFVEYTTAIISRLTDFIKDLFVKIKEFFTSLWQWIKSKFEAIEKKVKEFIKFVKDKFSGLVEYIFG